MINVSVNKGKLYEYRAKGLTKEHLIGRPFDNVADPVKRT